MDNNVRFTDSMALVCPGIVAVGRGNAGGGWFSAGYCLWRPGDRGSALVLSRAFVAKSVPDLLHSIGSLVALIVWIYFRVRNQETDRPNLNQRTASMVGSHLTLKNDIDIEGRIQIGDTLWKVRSEECLKKGDRVEVTDAEVSTLIITKIEAN